MRALTAAVLAGVLSTGVTGGASAGEHPPGCFPMLLVRVIDGDSVYGYVDTSDPAVAIRGTLRILGIDTPETGGRARGDAERAKAVEAKSYLASQLEESLSRPVRGLARACDIGMDKYGRRLGRLEVYSNHQWVDLGALLIKKGLAFPYDGGKRGQTWCTCLDSGQCPEGYQG